MIKGILSKLVSYIYKQKELSIGADGMDFVQAQPFYLAGSGAALGATSIVLKSFQTIDGTNLTMSHFGDKGFATIEPNNSSKEEAITFSGVTQNANGTATLTGVKSQLMVTPYTETSGLAKSHAGSVKLVISNTAGMYEEMVSQDNDETITGLYTFTQFPQKSGSTTPTSSSELVSKAYVDTVIGGTTIYDQNLIRGQAGEDLVAGELVYFKTSDAKWWKTDTDTSATVDGTILAFVQETIATDATGLLLIGGLDKSQTGLTPGATYYASATAGAISTAPGAAMRAIGKALTATSIILDPAFSTILSALQESYIPTSGEKQALSGTGTPSATNKYLTQDYLPTGSVTMFSGATAPTGWLLCDGSAVSRTTYATLFGVISTTYGAGDTTTTFNIPDFRGRAPVGVGTGAGGGATGTGLPTGGSALTAVARGTWKGAETHTLTEAQLPAHVHTIPRVDGAGAPNNKIGMISNGGSLQTASDSGSVGSGEAHNIIQPVMGINFIIKT